LGLAVLQLVWPVSPDAAAASFSNGTPIITGRGSHTATLLTNGKLLVTGGQTNGGFSSFTAELYDPATGTWTTAGSMNADRAHHTATMLPNGQVLVAGGYSSGNGALASVELYDPLAGTWTNTGSMIAARFLHTATLLPGGQVLIVGGTSDGSTPISQAELYDPVTGVWTATNSTSFARYSHTATLLPNGQVLIAGGNGGGGTPVAVAELYDPPSGNWTPTNSMSTARYSHTATLLPGREVLLAGGTADGATAIGGAELYDPLVGTWTPTNALNTARFDHSATLLPNGSVLVIGGTSDGNSSFTNAEVFNFKTGAWTITNALNTARYSHTATVLAGGEVLVVGGFETNQALSAVERYNPAVGGWTTTGPMTLRRAGYPIETLLPNGKVLVAGGINTDNNTFYTSAELYDPSSGSWRATASMSTARAGATCTVLSNRKVLVAGGFGGPGGGNYLASAEVYDPASGTWTATGSLHASRAYHTATLLTNGNILIAGGLTTNSAFTTIAELYDPATGTWTVIGALNTGRDTPTATLLPNGEVLMVGGGDRNYNALGSAELYDPGSRRWTVAASLNAARCNATATLLPSGKVLVAGGGRRAYGLGGALSSAELYDPTAGTWTMTGALPGSRNFHAATLLPNGQVLVAGGYDGTNGANPFTSAVLYDPPSGTWAATASLSIARNFSLTSLLPNGKVLVMGGQGTNYGCLSSAELYDPGLGFNESWRPQIASIVLPGPAAALNVGGSGLRGMSEASSGNSQDSPADYPVLELMSVNSGQVVFLTATNWSADSVASPPASSLPPGYLLGTIFVNGIPSVGQIFKVPSPPIIVNLPATAIGPSGATLNGQVLDTGGNVPSVTLYYGTIDAGTNTGAWEQSIAVGVQSGIFSETVSGLSTNTTYYFTARAVNRAGAAWAAPSQSFTTVIPPVVTNLPASGVQGTFATLNGQVLSTGHETPSVIFYYGTTDGGTDPTGWAQSLALGLQGGAFAQTVGGLLTNTTYFYTAQASNVAGTNWATPSLSFVTPASNSLAPSVAVLTQHNDNGRTGMNLSETVLNISNVSARSFGLLCARPVDDQIYAQPLVATNVSILGRGTHNLVIAVTVNDAVYAFDADDPMVSAPYWTNSFIHPPDIVPPNNADESAIGACGGNYLDFSGNIGIVGTPVIDPDSGTIYLVARTKEFGGNFVQRLHALDLATGQDRSNSPVVITATYPGTGSGSAGGVIAFDPVRQNQRPALVLANGVVYISWSAHCDNGPYHGWVIGYNAATLQQAAVWNDTPNGSEGGIWMSGQGPSADGSGNIYLTTGNGTVGGANYGESFLKLAPTNSGTRMNVASYFIPFNWSSLNSADLDLGTSGLLLVPGTSLAVSGGKSGTLYVVDRDNMGGVSNGNTNIIQSWTPAAGEIHSGPVWWTGPNGSYMYVWPDSGNRLRQYQFTNGLFNSTAFAQSATVGGAGSPGGILSLSANGTNAGSGILWAVVNTRSSANQAVVAGTLHAYNAQDVSSELWNSDILPRDALGNLAKFVPPTVANGKVYMATFSRRLNVYSLLPFANMLAPSTGPGGVRISFAGSPGLTYSVLRAPTVAGSWTKIANVAVSSSGIGSYLDPRPPADEAFYRVTYP
jgi:N-acetylneuraminic acid mutarotase